MRTISALILGVVCILILSGGPAAADTPLTVVEVASGLTQPVFITTPPGDNHRNFIVQQTGQIRILKDGSLLPQPFLDISGLITSGGERGLLGLAFDPGYDSTGWLYVNYTRSSDSATVVARYHVSGNPDSADENSAQIIISVEQPFANHNAGMLAFSPVDNYLYFGLGDGGAANDPGNRAQNPLVLLGKMLRLDVSGGIAGYSIPPDNPWVGAVDTLDEIWAFGLRNPWRYGFDRQTGDLYIGDVGQNTWEEIDYQLAASSGGENYGWRLKEGLVCFNPPVDCDTAGILTDPVHVYSHGGSPFRCSVTGGYVYRGCAVPDLQGTYFFGDYCSGQVWSFRIDADTVIAFQERTDELGLPAIDISSFGEDAQGELYIIAYNLGKIFKIVPVGVEPACDCCLNRGNADSDCTFGCVTVADLSFLVSYLFQNGPEPACLEEGNADSDCTFGCVTVADLSFLVGYLFQEGPPPALC